MKLLLFTLPAILPLTAHALSAASLSIPPPAVPMIPSIAPPITQPQTADIAANPWRIALDIGREPLANMPFKWARSGCRMPLVIPCDFQSDQRVIPRSETVSFTGPGGAVISPVQGGEWDVTKNNKEISFELNFPEYMERRDVWIEAGTTVKLIGTVYTQEELDRLDQEFYQARDQAWEIGGELNEIAKQKEAPKRWNEEEQAWEKRMDGVPSIFSQIQKRAKHWGAQAKQKRKANKRPSLNDLSEVGSMPGFDNNLFVQKQGIVIIGDSVAGRWWAEPIKK